MARRLGRLLALACAAAPTASPAQDAGPAPKPLHLRQLATNVYWSSEGGNVGVVVGSDGVIVYDVTGSPARAAELRARIAEITTKPIKAVILSHSDGDHVDGIGGMPTAIPIVAAPATGQEMRALAAAGQRGIAADRVPTKVVATSETLVLAGETVRLYHWGPAHTNGDLVAYFPREKVVFAADIFCMDQPRPYIKPEMKGSSAGWVKTANAVLALDPRWVVVGHGEPQTPAELRPFVARAAAARAGIVRLARQGKPLAEVEARVHEPQPSTPPPPPGAHLAQFTKVVYAETTGGR